MQINLEGNTARWSCCPVHHGQQTSPCGRRLPASDQRGWTSKMHASVGWTGQDQHCSVAVAEYDRASGRPATVPICGSKPNRLNTSHDPASGRLAIVPNASILHDSSAACCEGEHELQAVMIDQAKTKYLRVVRDASVRRGMLDHVHGVLVQVLDTRDLDNLEPMWGPASNTHASSCTTTCKKDNTNSKLQPMPTGTMMNDFEQPRPEI